jgi:hypothetical protein
MNSPIFSKDEVQTVNNSRVEMTSNSQNYVYAGHQKKLFSKENIGIQVENRIKNKGGSVENLSRINAKS